MTKRVLLIAYDFPPRGGTGVLRVTKFARYLPQWGWEPVVTTVDGPGPHPDPRLLAELPPQLEILRVRSLGTRQSTPAPVGALRGEPPVVGRRARLKRWIVPDPQIAWVPQAITVARRRLRTGDISAIVTSGPPFSTHLIGWWLRRWHGDIPWVMDMRDLWSEGVGQDLLVPYKLNRMLEQQCLNVADHTTVVSDTMRTLTLQNFVVAPSRISTITNGYDPNDFSSLPVGAQIDAQAGAETTGGPLMLRFVGTLAESQAVAAQGFFGALRCLNEEGIGHDQLRVQFIGTFGESIHRWAVPLIEAGIVEILPFMPHEQALMCMRNADVLLFMLRDDRIGRVAHGNKLFEYLALEQPILAIAPPGEATRLIEAEEAGLTAGPNDVPAIMTALRRFLADKKAPTLSVRKPDPARLHRFQRRELAGQLAHLLNELRTQRGAA